MCQNGLGFIILAAGKGTRMRSKLPKVFHHLADLPLVEHVMNSANSVGAEQICLVVGPEFEDKYTPKQEHVIAWQMDRLGTGHATKIGLQALSPSIKRVVVLFGDVPLMSAEAMARLGNSSAAISLLGFQPDDPAMYGRVATDANGSPTAIIEFKDASEAQKQIRLCNGGPMSFDVNFLKENIDKLSDENAQGEFYLTDMLKIAVNAGLNTELELVGADELTGVNTRLDLAYATKLFQQQQRKKFMLSGVTLQDPDSVIFSHDTEIAADVTIEPNVVFGPGVSVESGAKIRAFSHLEGAQVSSNAIIGPYARLRPGTSVGEGVKIGNFVETKNTVFHAGAKANHLSYVGDAEVGAKANIGAGTITCNYDGYNKSKTIIGEGAFIGSNTAL
ncbi:MAG: bifunctional UDP-N-acetylglucosamine diphosphorylase/glucosamine-1-phosphate N-acetyltransferase GlmU, partial [Alphaproteobacteria bacterium]